MNSASGDHIAFISHPKLSLYRQPFPKPHLESFESPLRIEMAELYLREKGIFEKLTKIKAPRAQIEDTLIAHSPYLVDTVRVLSKLGSGELGEAAFASPDLLRTSLIAIGGAMHAATLAASDVTKHAFALIRPPGHHASTSNPMGLCYFNNIAIALKQVMKQHEIQRATIIDIDSHFGNGTSEIFYANKQVQYISIHDYDYENFGTGHYEEIGYGEALGTNINIPLLEISPDISYRSAFDKIVIPAIERFEPDLIAVSAGYDTHYADPVGNMDVDSRTYWYIGNRIDAITDSLNIMGSFWVLEGGYNPIILGPSIEASLLGLIKQPQPKLPDQVEREVNTLIVDTNQDIMERVLKYISPHW